MEMAATTLNDVRDVLVQTLGIDDPGRIADASTPLFGNIPELDSLAVVTLAMALESRFGFQIDDTDFSAEIFETMGSLAGYVDRNRRQ